MKLENINFKGETYNFSFSRYSSSNFIAILMGLPDDEYPDIITTNNSVMEKDENDPTEYVQIRTDNPEYVKLLVNNGLIEDTTKNKKTELLNFEAMNSNKLLKIENKNKIDYLKIHSKISFKENKIFDLF